MYVRNRIVTLEASPSTWVPWAIEVTSTVNAITGMGTSCWMARYGAPLGSFAFTTRAEAEADLEVGLHKVAVDGGYQALADQAVAMHAAVEDSLWTAVYGGSHRSPSRIGAVGLMTTATALVDRYPDAVRWGVEMGQLVESITQRPMAVLTSIYGPMGSLAWIAVSPDLDGHEADRDRLMGNGEYHAKMREAKDLFLPGTGHVVRSVKLA